MTLGGGVDLAREPRNGRNFEYAGEDPLLAGTLVGNLMKCEQGQHVVGDIKHYVMNDQETGRFFVNSVISKRAMQVRSARLSYRHLHRESGAVMCSYNRINGDFGCENPVRCSMHSRRLGIEDSLSPTGEELTAQRRHLRRVSIRNNRWQTSLVRS
jgi:beta-glucosidase-like glycosyl hydrolase